MAKNPSSADFLNQLTQGLANQKYTPKTDEQIQQQAANKYASAYEAKRNSAQQAYDTQALNFDQQMATKRDDIAKSIERSNQQYLQNYNNNNRTLQSHGMQRSSYGLATGANILNAGAKAAQDIQDAGDKELGNIGAQKALAGNQLAQTLDSLNNQQQNDILAYGDELRDKDYDRGVAADQNYNNLLTSIYQFKDKQEADDLAQKNFEIEFDAKYGKGAYANGGVAPRSGGGGPKKPGKDRDILDVDGGIDANRYRALLAKQAMLSGTTPEGHSQTLPSVDTVAGADQQTRRRSASDILADR